MTPEEHERIQETLAGHALHALDDAEASQAEALVASHVATCSDCRAALQGFRHVAGELGLAAHARRPPSRLGSRIRRDTRPQRVAAWAGRVVGAAAAAAIVSVLLWNVLLTGRVSKAEHRSAQTTAILTTVAHPDSRVVPLAVQDSEVQEAQLTAAFVPGRAELFLFGSLPAPASGSVYQVWLVQRGGLFSNAGTFVPNAGSVLLQIAADPSTYEGVLITREPHPGSQVPSSRHMVRATF
jgi:anti-sigma-K factor RskA